MKYLLSLFAPQCRCNPQPNRQLIATFSGVLIVNRRVEPKPAPRPHRSTSLADIQGWKYNAKIDNF